MQHLQPNTILQGGKYRIEQVLGQGGFGNTYVGYNTEFEETVAIKEFFMKGVTEREETTSFVSVSNADNVQQFEEQREKFKKEARRLRKLKNKHIVKVHDLFEENGTAYYVMDNIDGESLAEKMKKTGQPFTEAEVRSILSQILEALKEVHQNEIWHLDLKPGNIMLDKSGNAYLIDFGASKQIRANGSVTTSTALCCTPGYAPTEQIGQMYDRFGPWTDIYALGATVYNLLTNKMPPMAIDIEENEDGAFEFSTKVSDEMRKLVVWMMQPKRKARPQNVDDIIEMLSTKHLDKAQALEKNVSMPNSDAKIKTSTKTKSKSKTKTAPKLKAESKTEIKQEIVTDSEETLLANSNTNKVIESSQSDNKESTILLVSKSNKKPQLVKIPIQLPQRAIKVGDLIYEDGSYSDEKYNNKKKLIGVLYSYYGGAHGQIFSAVKPDESMSINDKELKWHEASIAEWVEIIQNIGHCKVNFASWEYRFFSNDVRDILSGYQLNEVRYATRKSVSGVAYIVNLESCRLTPIEGDNVTLPYIYISEF